MISSDVFASCFGSVPSGDDESLVRVVVHAVRQGFAIVLCHPGTKKPLCTLTTRQAKTEDRKTQEAAKEAGDTYWQRRRHACGLHHALTDDVAARRVTTRLVKELGAVNLGVELGRSRMIVVDVDTDQEKHGFLSSWEDELPAGEGVPTEFDYPTVLSPGSRDRAGNWVHQDGGHYWFTVPEGIELPEGLGVLKGEGGWAVLWRDKQVLVPPSKRQEGVYRLVGAPVPAPPWLLEFIQAKTREHLSRRERAVRTALDSDSAIDRWAATATWGELLEPDGWSDTGLADNCGCPVWTAPGSHASPKSATAHDLGCIRFDSYAGHAPLHVWTDNPPEWVAQAIEAKGGARTLTKLTYLAHRFYGGDAGAALRGMGVGEDRDTEFPGFTPGPGGPVDYFGTGLGASPAPASSAGAGDGGHACDPEQGDDATEDDEDEDGEDGEEEDEPDPVDLLVSQFLTLEQMADLPDMHPLVAGVLDLDSVNRVTGKSNHGKTFVMLDLAGRVATGTDWCGRTVTAGLVAYVAAEGSRGIYKRARAWESHHGAALGDRLRVLPFPVQATDYKRWHEMVRALERLSPALIVFDTQARITVGADENSAQDMGILVERVESVRKATGACVVLVHHLGHAAEHGRGSSAVIGAMSTEIKVTKGEEGRICVSCVKQKDHEQFEAETGRLVTVERWESAVMAYDAEEREDPFDVPAPEDDAPLWVRMVRLIAEAAPTQGLTRLEAISLTRGRFAIPVKNRMQAYRAWDLVKDGGYVEEGFDVETGKSTNRFTVVPGALERVRNVQ